MRKIVKTLASCRQKAIVPCILAALWAFSALLVNPVGDFPLNDDFSFGKTVLNFLEGKRPLFDDWLSMTLMAQVLWGAFFCKIGGFSFTVLRLSTLVAGLIGLLFFYKTARSLGQGKSLALIATTTIAFNPLFFSLSFTFMSDVPFCSALMAALFFYVKFFQTAKTRWLASATAAVMVACLIRQLGLVLPLAFALVWLFSGKTTWQRAWQSLLPLAVILSGLHFYQQWFEAMQGLPATYGTFAKLFSRLQHDSFPWVSLQRSGLLLMYMGLFFLPVLLMLWPKPMTARQTTLSVLAGALGVGAITTVLEKIPWGNIIYNLGLGPKVLKDGYFFINVSPTLPASGLWMLKIAGMAAGVLLTATLCRFFYQKQAPSGNAGPVQAFFIIGTLIYGGFLLLDTHCFDRYFIPLLPLGLLLFMTLPAPSVRFRWLRAVAFAALAGMTVFSVTATHDYLAWNRARWAALHYLTKEKAIPPNRIDGGFEFNGWHRPVKERDYDSPKSWWWVDRDDYVVTFGPMDGFQQTKAFGFVKWLPPGKDSVYVLERQ